MVCVLFIGCLGSSLDPGEAGLKLTVQGGNKGFFYINEIIGFRKNKVDSFRLDKDFSYVLKTDIGQSSIYSISNNVNNKEIYVFLEEGAWTNINTSLKDFDNYKLDGGESSEKLKNFFDDLKIKQREHSAVKKLISEKRKKEGKEWVYDGKGIELERRYDEKYMEIKSYIKDFVNEEQVEELKFLALTQLNLEEDMYFIYKNSQVSSGSPFVLNVQEIVNGFRQGMINNIDFNVQLNDINQKRFSCVDPNKLTLLFFWASWCHSSKEDIERINKLYEKNKDKLRVIAFSLDKNQKQYQEGIKELNFYPDFHYCQFKGWDDPQYRKWGFGFLPSNFLLDQKGNLLAKNMRGEELDSFFNNQSN